MSYEAWLRVHSRCASWFIGLHLVGGQPRYPASACQREILHGVDRLAAGAGCVGAGTGPACVAVESRAANQLGSEPFRDKNAARARRP